MPSDLRPERVVLINDFATVRGGATSQAHRLAGRLVEADVDVTFFSGETPETKIEGARHISLGGRRVSERSAVRAAISGFHNAAAARELSRLIDDHDSPDTIYHVHGWCQILSPSIFGPLDRVAPRVVFHAHDLSLICPNIVYFDFSKGHTCARVPVSGNCLSANCDKRSYPQKVWRWTRHKRFYGTAHRLRETANVIAVHEAMEPFLRLGRIGGTIFPVRNTSDAFLDSPIRTETNQRLLFVGQLFDFKGALDFAQAAAGLDAPVTIVGEGPDRREMERLCPKAKFTGWLTGDALRQEVSAARAIVVPTRGIEPFGLVVVEALKSGIPVIVSDGVFLSGEVEAGCMGLTFPAGNHNALRDVMRRISEDDALVGQLSMNAAQRGKSLSPSEKEWFSRICDVYSRTLARHPVNDRSAEAGSDVSKGNP